MEISDTTIVFDTKVQYLLTWLSDNFGTIIFIIIIGFLTVFVARSLNRFMERYLTHMNHKLRLNATNLRMFRHIVIAIIYFIGLAVIINNIPLLHSFSIALFTGAGVIGIVFGLAAQSTLSNIIAGIALTIFQPFRVGDRLDIMNEYGKVEDLNLRHTVITTWDNRRIIIPNSKISTEAIINWTIKDPAIIWSIEVGISVGSDIDKARTIMFEEARKNPNVMPLGTVEITNGFNTTLSSFIESDLKERGKIKVFVTGLNLINNIIELRLQVWFNDRGIAYNSGCDIREAIIKRFSEEGMLKKA